jgi:two-component system sensor histidine kinase HydH
MERGPERTSSVTTWVGLAALILLVSSIAAAHYRLSRGSVDGASIEHLYYVPVVSAALFFGWRGGLGVGLYAAATLLLIAGQGQGGEALILCIIGAATGWFIDRERRQKRQYQDVAAKLSSVYEQLQINFEGMKRAERLSAIGHLSAGLAHEIRNPLASIGGAASILRRTVSSDPKIIRCIEIIEGECRRLNGLLTNFLNFARPRSPQFQTTNLNVLLAEVIELAEHAVNRRQIVFRQEISDGLTAVDCDPEQLRQVLLNLVINAVEASSEDTTVVLFAAIEDGSIVIRVVDEGSGVTPEDIDKLFDPFFTTKETGTGLGLPVAHQIIGQMGGNLSARRNPERGMTFSVVLPWTRRSVA